MHNDTLNYLDKLISRDELSSLFVDAIEQGINYWCGDLPEIERCAGDSEYYAERFWQHIQRGEEFEVEDEDGEYTGKINMKSVDNALGMIIKDHPRLWMEIKEEEYDVISADVFFQLCVFGEVIFG